MHSTSVCTRDKVLPTMERSTIVMSYPQHWFAPLLESPFSKTVEEETIQWMKKLGLLPDKQIEMVARKMEMKYYTGYSVSMASYDFALVYCKKFSLWILWDDAVVEKSLDIAPAMPPIRVLAGEPVDLSDPYVAAFKHIGDEFERLGASHRHRARLAEAMKDWVIAAVEEQNMRTSEENVPFEKMAKVRSFAIGFHPTVVWIERSLGIELPDEILEDEIHKKLVELSGFLCGIGNDMAGLGKDMANNQIKSNFILYHNLLYKTSIVESIQAIVDMHDRGIAEFDTLAKQLEDKAKPIWKERVTAYLNGIRYANNGFLRWESNAQRYKQYVITEDNQYFDLLILPKSSM